MNYRAAVAELIGTFMLTFLVFLSLTIELPLATPVVAGLTLGTFVYVFGAVSGTHLNPAVTLALLSIKKIKQNDAVLYIIAQIVGAMIAMVLGGFFAGGGTELAGEDGSVIMLCEALGAFILLLGISAVVHGKAPHDAAGLTIGGALTLGIFAASGGSYGVLNPAVAMGIGAMSLSYILAPVIGAVAGAWAYQWIAGK